MKSIGKKLKTKKILTVAVILLSIMTIILGTLVFLNWNYISFKLFLSSRYLKTDILDQLYEEQIGMDIEGKYYKYFDNLSIAAVTKLIRDTGKDNYTYQYNPDQFKDYTSNRDEKAEKSYTKQLTNDTIYMSLTNFTPVSLDFFKNSIDEIGKYNNLVLDLRNNGGGDLDIIFEVADYFIEKNCVLVVENRRQRTSNIKAKKDKYLYFDKIVILQNKKTASASEQLIIALDANIPELIKVGTRTYGKYVGQTRIALLRRFYVKATTLEWTSPDGQAQHPDGIQPDFVYEGEDIISYVINEIL